MSFIGYINMSWEIFGSLVSLIIVLCLMTSRDRKSKLNRIFLSMLLCNSVILMSDAVTWMFMGGIGQHNYFIVRIATFCIFIFAYPLGPLFTNYLITFMDLKGNVTKIILRIIVTANTIGAVLVIVALFNHMYYDFDVNNVYFRGNLFWLSQIWGVLTEFLCTGLILYNWKKLKRWNVVILLSYSILPLLAMMVQVFIYGLALFYISTTLSLVAIYIGIQSQRARLLKEKELALSESRIDIMLSQIKPHFLYNSLTAIAQLCDDDPGKAEKATMDFSAYLRGNMDSLNDKGLINFENELNHIRGYLNLERAIYGKALDVVYHIEVSGFLLPPLTVQPIVENAIKHGIGKREGGGTVTVSSRETEKEYILIVSDDGMGFNIHKPRQDNQRTHIGIENVRKRLAEQCSGTLVLESEPGIGTVATIRIPKEGMYIK